MKIRLIVLFYFFISNNYPSENKSTENKDIKKLSEIITKKEGPAAYIISEVFGIQPNQKGKNKFEHLKEKK